jgi:hypothetical protein
VGRVHVRNYKFVVSSSQIMIHQCADALCHKSMNDHKAEQRSSYHVTNKLRADYCLTLGYRLVCVKTRCSNRE